MKILRQGNPMWAQTKLGGSNLTIGRYGCTTCSISMLTDAFDDYRNPIELATKVLNYTRDGLLIWQSVNNTKAFNFVTRQRGRNDAEIQKALKDPSKCVILEVNNGTHWVTAIKKSRIFNDYWIADPWFGSMWYACKRYGNITGYAIFQAK